MTLSRLDLEGLGSPAAIAAQIHLIESKMPLAVPVEELRRKLDIIAIDEIDTSGFEAALVRDPNKACGSILGAAGRTRQRSRYSISHELGHFLIPAYMPRPGQGFECSLADLHLLDPRERDRRKGTEMQANRFAADLLMPKAKIRANASSRSPDLAEIIRLARDFDVSKEAMARAYIDAQHEPLAVVILRNGRLVRIYRAQDDFPWIAARVGQPVPTGSIAEGHQLQPGQMSECEDCDPEIWFGEREAKRVNLLTEQLLSQQQGFSMLLLHAEAADDDEPR